MNNEMNLIGVMRSAIDNELHKCINDSFEEGSGFKTILDYQMGWSGSTGNINGGGKRLRPLLVLLACHSLEGDWHKAIPAATAIELIHNFSLVHDDIQDQSLTRRGKDTIWVKWGIAQAINAGDAILALANLELLNLNLSKQQILESIESLHKATFLLTAGQYLDLAYEKAEDISLKEYWKMVDGKTGALFAASFELGGLSAGKKKEEILRYKTFGREIGLAFQVQDDFLGIWGNDRETGKSVDNDLLSRKKSYPILYALENLPQFREAWVNTHDMTENEVSRLREILTYGDVKKHTQKMVRTLYDSVMKDFQEIYFDQEKSKPLKRMIEDLLYRVK